jgi:phosphatidylglycerophosphate synthase
MLSEKLGHAFDKPLAGFAKKISFSPNSLSVAGFVVTLFASCVLLFDLRIGGLLVLAGGAFDVLDGVVARTNGKSSGFGAFLDSVLDRYSDAAMLLAIAWNVADPGNYTGVMLCLGALVGAFLISYTRARAEGLGHNCSYGLMERPERVILISFGAIANLMMPVLWILFLLTHFTVLQRIYHVWRLTGNGRMDS